MTGTEASPEIAASHAACEEITRREAANFYHGLKLTPMPQRQGLFALYAWMRRADDIVDDGEGGAAARADALERFAEETRAAFAGERPSGDPMWPAFIDSCSASARSGNRLSTCQRRTLHEKPFTTASAYSAHSALHLSRDRRPSVEI